MNSAHTTFKVKKNKLGRYSYFGVVFSTTLALFVIGIFFSLIIYSKELERIVRENVNIQVFLQHHVTETQHSKIKKELALKYFIANDTPEKKAIQFTSQENATKQFINEAGEDFQQLLGENPLRSYFSIRVAKEYQDVNNLSFIKNDIEKIPGIFQVFYVENVIDSVNKNITKISLILLGVGILLFSIVILLINNAIKLALFSQRFLIRSMQLVGATSWFIQKAFLYRALINGLIAGLLSSVLLLETIQFVNQQIENINLIYNSQKIYFLAVILVVLGMAVSLLSTLRVVSKFLKLSLDELH